MITRNLECCRVVARQLVQKLATHGVITAGTDESGSVAAIARALALTGIRYIDAEACSNKVLMRRRLQQYSLPIPNFYSVWSLKEAREAMDSLSFPLVLKPAENMGARGVIKISKRSEMLSAFKHTQKHSPTGEMILEEYMLGAELSIDALAWNGQIAITGIADRIIAREPFFIELGHNMPSAQQSEVLEEASEVMRQSMHALGIHTGAAKGDIKITKEGIKIGEIAARLSGGFMSSHTYPLYSGVNLLGAAIQIALGEEPQFSVERPPKNVAIERGILSAPGKILKLTGADKMLRVEGIEHVHINHTLGELVPPLTSNIDKVGHIVATGVNLEEAEAAVEKALSYFEIELDESYGVDWHKVKEQARLRFSDKICWVCKSCDGSHCASGVPGMGGVGENMESFQDNSRALAEIKILPRYIREEICVDTCIEFLGRKFEHPIMGAPMTGVVTNMNGALDEYEFALTLLQACRANGSVAWVGDGASPERYKIIMRALEDSGSFGVLICKPRADTQAIIQRFRHAEKIGLLAVGMDIDALSFKTMQLKKQATLARSMDALKSIRESTFLPFILKGIMSVEDAQAAVDIGVDAIVVSNHGGRILEAMPGTARVLEDIALAVGDKITILVDGGIRSGQDVFKMLALGAQAVLVGRPLAIAAVGGGQSAVNYLLARYARELRHNMNICGTAGVDLITTEYIQKCNVAKVFI